MTEGPGTATQLQVVYGNYARGVMPILARFTFADASTSDVAYPAESWRTNSTRYAVTATFKQPVTKLELGPDHHFIDTDRKNNVWTVR